MSFTLDGIEIRTRPITMIKCSCGCFYNEDGHGVVQVGDVVSCPEDGDCGAANRYGETTVLSFIEIEATA